MSAEEPEVSPAWRFLSASFTVGTLSLTRLVAGLARTKIAAIFLSTAGVGLFAQGNLLLSLGVTAGSLSLTVGLISKIASARASNDMVAARSFTGSALVLQLATIAAIVAIGILGSRALSALTFGGPRESLFLVVLLAIPFATLASGFVEAILFGHGRYDLYTKASIWATLAGVLVFVLFVLVWGLEGAFWSIPLGALALFTSFVVYVRKIQPLRDSFTLSFDALQSRQLLRYGLVVLAVAVVGAAVLLGVRSYLIARLGASVNGLYQVPIAFTAYYTPFLTNGLWARLHPQVSAKGDSRDSFYELRSALRLVFIAATGVVLCVLVAQRMAILVVYAPEFLPAEELIPLQLAGDLAYFVSFTLGVFFLALPRLRAYLALWLTYYAILAVTSVVLIDRVGRLGAPLGYLAATSILAVMSIAWFSRSVRGATLFDLWPLALLCWAAVAAQVWLTIADGPVVARVGLVAVWLGGVALVERGALERALRFRRGPLGPG